MKKLNLTFYLIEIRDSFLIYNIRVALISEEKISFSDEYVYIYNFNILSNLGYYVPFERLTQII